MFRTRFQHRATGLTAPASDNGRSEILSSVEGLRTHWFWASDRNGRLTYVSDWLPDEFECGPGDLIGQELTSLMRMQQVGEESTLGFHLVKRKPLRGVNIKVLADARERIWTISATPQLDTNGDFNGYSGIGTDVTAAQESAREISRLASYDQLTGLRNRRGMSALVERSLLICQHGAMPFSILLIDLDRFKQVNDALGHPVGDALLQQVAERLREVVGDDDCVGRIGGDEFQVVLSGRDNREGLTALADALIAELSRPYMINDSRCVIGASVGVVIAPVDGTTKDELTRNADLALYAAKAAGRGRHRFFTREMHEEAEDRRLLEQDLLDALGRGELEVNYQPLVCVKTNVVKGFEALLRWNHPHRGRISPALFIPIAEDANLISQLGEWVLRQACLDASKWPEDLTIAVNVSSIQFVNPNLVQVVVGALAQSGLTPNRLELEITESVFLSESAETSNTFAALKKIGVRLALDDFGTGYSSLGYLRNAPFDKIKIDQSFVRGSPDPKSRNNAIITSIVALAKAMEMETTAEGIETVDQLETMRSLDVGLIQGYLFSLPVESSVVTEKVSGGRWEIKPIGPAKQRGNRVATFRRIAAVHGNQSYPVILRNLSATGALIAGLVDVPVDTRFVLDFGNGQWAVATVIRSQGDYLGLAFDEPLIADDEGGFRTMHRVPPMTASKVGSKPAGARGSATADEPDSGNDDPYPVFRTTLI